MISVAAIEQALVDVARHMEPFGYVGRVEGDWIAEIDDELGEVNLTRLAERLAAELEAVA